MMRPRTLRIIAWVLMLILGTLAIEGYDVLSGGNITEMFFEPNPGCYG